MSDILRQLQQVLDSRKNSGDKKSYVASLHQKGLNKILEKVGEEATEVILAAKDAQLAKSDVDKQQNVINETADLWFHSMVMLSNLGLSSDDVIAELERRFGISGIEEKASRQQT